MPATAEITVTDITAALRDADIAHRVEHPGTTVEAIAVTNEHGERAYFGPCTLDGNGQPISPADGVDCAWRTSDGGVSSQDWFATVDELVEALRRFLA